MNLDTKQQPEHIFADSEALRSSRQLGDVRYADGKMYTKLPSTPTAEAEMEFPRSSTAAALSERWRRRVWWAGQVGLFVVVVLQSIVLYGEYLPFAGRGCSDAVEGGGRKAGESGSSKAPDYYQTFPFLYPGPTKTGAAAFLAQTNPAPFASTTYIPNTPLETQVPINGLPNDGNIFQLMGPLSPYYPNPKGFGVDEYSLPEGAEIVQLNMLSRHGSRYPASGAGAKRLGKKIEAHLNGTLGNVEFEGGLAFLNDWNYLLGDEILVPVGKQELFNSGVLHQYMYGHLYPNDGSRIVVRSTTQHRMVESAEYFLAGFFGLDWSKNATLVLQIESFTGVWNNSFAGYYNCPNSNSKANKGGFNASAEWSRSYLADAAKRLTAWSPGFTWSTYDAYNAQSMCAYETVALGYSSFCGLFTYEEWEGYEYSEAIRFAGSHGFQSPTGRAVGIPYVAEVLARLEHHLITEPTAQVNLTLDSNEATFPLNQTLNLDFSHDSMIMTILTAFGFKQFASFLPTTHREDDRQLIVSHVTPFGARLDMEVIHTPAPLSGNRKSGDTYEDGDPTRYIHFILNQRTLPLGVSFPECGDRDDGWCELETFLRVQSTKLEEAEYEWSCFGEYEALPYGSLSNGVPQAQQ